MAIGSANSDTQSAQQKVAIDLIALLQKMQGSSKGKGSNGSSLLPKNAGSLGLDKIFGGSSSGGDGSSLLTSDSASQLQTEEAKSLPEILDDLMQDEQALFQAEQSTGGVSGNVNSALQPLANAAGDALQGSGNPVPQGVQNLGGSPSDPNSPNDTQANPTTQTTVAPSQENNAIANASAQMANFYTRNDSNAATTGNGNEGCVDWVNHVLSAAGVQPFNTLGVAGEQSEIEGGRGTQVSASQAAPGDIVIVNNGQGSAQHTGIVESVKNGVPQIRSNASSQASGSGPATWVANGAAGFAAGIGASTGDVKFYRLKN